MIISVRNSTCFIPSDTFIGLLLRSNWTRTLAMHYIKVEQTISKIANVMFIIMHFRSNYIWLYDF